MIGINPVLDTNKKVGTDLRREFVFVAVTCPPILDPRYVLSRPEHHYGIQVNYTCQGRFRFADTTRKVHRLSRCQYNGHWEPPLAECFREFLTSLKFLQPDTQ